MSKELVGIHFGASIDVEQIRKDASVLQSTINQTNAKIKQTEGALKEAGSKDHLGKPTAGANDLTDALNKAKNAAAAFFTMQAAAGFVKQIATVRGEFQQLEVGFKTMLQSEEKATALMEQITKTAATTPFGLQNSQARQSNY